MNAVGPTPVTPQVLKRSQSSEDAVVALPPLREDLQLLEGITAPDGSPTWTIHDPLRNRYYQIGWEAFQLLSRWSLGRMDRLMEVVARQTTFAPTPMDVAQMMYFLQSNSLTRNATEDDVKQFKEQLDARRHVWWKWLIHNYLFIRIPLLRPDRFLRRTLPLVEPLFSRGFGLTILSLGLIGLYLVARQWEAFLGTFPQFFNLQGLALYGVALAVLKVLHEMGHGYTATRYGCRVPTMGVALIVMWPVLYTDTTDAWRLTDRRKRLAIAAAGMTVELSIALLATFAWSFLPDGPLRSVAFVAATISWVTTVAVNTNPFMRFDGYYLASDILGVDNLQSESFAIGRWRLRRLLFGLDDPPPGNPAFTHAKRRVLTAYAWGTWLYRLLLFFGIALLVYAFFFKVLGILLFLVEIVWFIARPVWSEVREWWPLRQRIVRSPRAWLGFVMLGGILLAMILPLDRHVAVPAVLQTREVAVLYPHADGRITAVHISEGARVHAGDLLLSLASPDLDSRLAQASLSLKISELQLDRAIASEKSRSLLRITLENQVKSSAELAGLERQRKELIIRAPFDGVIMDANDDLHPGRWINSDLQLGLVVAPESGAEFLGYVQELDLHRLAVGQHAVFYPEDLHKAPIPGTVVEVGSVASPKPDTHYLDSTYGGPLPVRPDPDKDDHDVVFEESEYKVRVLPDDPSLRVVRVLRGTLQVEAKPESWLTRIGNRVAGVMVRESGF